MSGFGSAPEFAEELINVRVDAGLGMGAGISKLECVEKLIN